jgi:hypothetical protein
MKTCTVCNIEKKLSEFYLYKSKYKARCNECTSKYYKIQNDEKKKNIVIDVTQSKTCNTCDITKNIVEFGFGKNKCKLCWNIDYRHYINNNQKAFLIQLLSSAKKNSKNRKGSAAEFNITIDDIINLTINQNNKCYYSNIELSYRRHCNWQASIERLDPTQGYISTNIALICLEFQSISQWTTEKYKEFTNLLFQEHEKQIINYNPDIIRKKKKCYKTKRQTINNIEYITCNYCDVSKTIDKFTKKIYTCKDCMSIKTKKYKRTPTGHFSHLLSHMKTNSKERKHVLPEFTVQELIDLFEAQNGLCKYTNIPMTFGSYKEQYWTLSAERKNNNIGYTKENTVLICYEFNTGDYTMNAADSADIIGSSQWSIEKIEKIKNIVISKNLEKDFINKI